MKFLLAEVHQKISIVSYKKSSYKASINRRETFRLYDHCQILPLINKVVTSQYMLLQFLAFHLEHFSAIPKGKNIQLSVHFYREPLR